MRLHYPEGPKCLHISVGDVVFWVDGVERTFRHRLYGEIITCLATASPKTVELEEIFERMQAVGSLGSRLNLEATVHKYVHGARQDLLNAGLKMEVIRNVRSLGYRLADGWKVESTPSPQTLAVDELSEIRHMVEKCIEHVENRRIETNAGGLMYLDRDISMVTENMIILDRIGWQLIHSLSEPEIVPDILDIKRDISQLLSYVMFSRVGHRLTVDEWRQDYRQEIKKVYGDIAMRINKIKGHYSAFNH